MPIPFFSAHGGVSSMQSWATECVQTGRHLCACRAVINHHWAETRCFSSEPEATYSVDKTASLWKTALRNARLHGFLSAVCATVHSNITGQTHTRAHFEHLLWWKEGSFQISESYAAPRLQPKMMSSSRTSTGQSQNTITPLKRMEHSWHPLISSKLWFQHRKTCNVYSTQCFYPEKVCFKMFECCCL